MNSRNGRWGLASLSGDLFAMEAKEEFSSLELNMVELVVVEVAVVILEVLWREELELAIFSTLIS